MTRERLPHLIEARLRHGVEQRLRGDDEPGSAEAALQGVLLDERRLHGAQLALGREALDGGDRMAARIDGQEHAGVHRLAVEQDGAAAALTAVADLLRARQRRIEPIPERVEKRDARLDPETAHLAVDLE